MKYKKMVDFDALTEEEKEAIELGDKTEEDLIKEWDQQEEEERKKLLEEAQKAKELADNYKIRAEKAESRTKEVKETPKNDLTYLDTIALVKADVSDEDISDIMDYASMKKISVAEALKSSVVKSLLKLLLKVLSDLDRLLDQLANYFTMQVLVNYLNLMKI